MNTYRCRRCFARLELELDEDPPEDEMCTPCVTARSRAVPHLDVEAIFAKGGPLDGGNPNYETRPGQVALAKAIFNTVAKGGNVIAEGPCGIGKSKAYGVPAAYLASQGKRVLVVTASIALQEQLIKKDLPDLHRELGWDFTFALMKGKANYLCVEEARNVNADGLTSVDLLQYRDIKSWSAKTKTGDKSELLIKPSDLVWGRFSTTSDACPGRKCRSFDACHAIKARDAAAQAGIVVTNYHMFFLNMAIGGNLLPAADVAILDEAHEATDIARDIFGFKISEWTFRRYERDAKKRGASAEGLMLREAASSFFARLLRFAQSGHYKSLLRWPAPLDCTELEEAVNAYASACAESHHVDHALVAIGRLKEGLQVKDPNCVYWIEVKECRNGFPASASLQAKYVNVGGVLEEKLWNSYDAVAAVSATLTTDGGFDYARRELGVPKTARELAVESPFAFDQQALLVLPEDLPEPNDPAFVNVAARRVIEVIEACGGRTLALFTSYRALNAIYEIVHKHFGSRFRILRQGDAPPGRLAQLFKDDPRSVLLGTSSFWTGIDVPGEALTGLVIDRIPFGSPEDPVTIRLSESDPRGVFAKHTVPRSILTFRQGVGRLIRSQADVGTVVVLDKRLSTKGYGARFIKSLPTMARATSTAAIRPFLRERGICA